MIKFNKTIIYSMVILGIILLTEVIITVYLPDIKKVFFNALQLKDIDKFWFIMEVFAGVVFLLTCVQGIKTWLGQRIGLLFRTQMTEYLFQRWIVHPNVPVTNASQRLNEDCRLCTELSVAVLLEIIISLGIVITLIFNSRSDFTVLVLSLIYTVGVIGISLFYKNYLITTEINMQQAEADHRFSLSTITMNQNNGNSVLHYEFVKEYYNKYIKTLLNYGIFNRAQSNFMPLIGYICLIGSYFAGSTLGSYMERVAIFDLIVVNSTILVQMYPQVTKAQASWRRIDMFRRELND